MTSALVYAALAGAVAVVNAAYGRLRAPAPRRSHAWFGCLAAPVMLLIALRKLFAFSWAGWAGLVAAAVLGQVIGWQLGARDGLPSPVRWRLAVYAGLLGALLIGLCEPLHAAHRATAGTGYQRLARVPEFVRPMVRDSVERHARERGCREITCEVMDEVKSSMRM